MKKFLDENFLLQTKSAQDLYHGFAKEMPIIDYHNHLLPEQIANDFNFENLTQVWLYGDHYKWRAMRTNGVNEKYCTGDAPDMYFGLTDGQFVIFFPEDVHAPMIGEEEITKLVIKVKI